MVCDTPHYGHAHTHQISLTYLERQKCYGPDNKILFKKNIIWPWGQRSRSHKGHYGTRHTILWSCTHIPNIIDLSRKTKTVMARTIEYYLKNNYLTFMSKVKVQRRSLWYATHHLMDMHPHTKYHWPISKDKKVMVRTSFAEKQKRKKKNQTKTIYKCISPFVRRGDIIKIHIKYGNTFFWNNNTSLVGNHSMNIHTMLPNPWKESFRCVI